MGEKKGQISEQKASDQTMNDLLEIVENSFDGILVADGEGTVQFGNIAYERNTGIKLDDIVGRNKRLHKPCVDEDIHNSSCNRA